MALRGLLNRLYTYLVARWAAAYISGSPSLSDRTLSRLRGRVQGNEIYESSGRYNFLKIMVKLSRGNYRKLLSNDIADVVEDYVRYDLEGHVDTWRRRDIRRCRENLIGYGPAVLKTLYHEVIGKPN